MMMSQADARTSTSSGKLDHHPKLKTQSRSLRGGKKFFVSFVFVSRGKFCLFSHLVYDSLMRFRACAHLRKTSLPFSL